MKEAPSASRKHFFSKPEQVYYGTDDGSKDGSFGEFVEFEQHYNSVSDERKENIHMVSVVGGLYGLNLIPLWQPKRITFFDINPMAVVYFGLIRRVFISSNNAAQFMQRLTDGDYSVESEDEQFLKENIITFIATGDLDPARGAIMPRTLDVSWKKALEHFDITKRLLTEIPIEFRTEPMESESFSEMIRSNNNHWIYASNITQFHFFELEILDPSNVVVLRIHHEETQLLDLAPHAGHPVKLKFEIPLSVERLS